MKRLLFTAAFSLCALAAHADEPLLLDVHESRAVVQSGATAAYTLEPGVAEAVLRNGEVTLIGRSAGVTQLVVVSGANVTTVNVIVRTQRAANIAPSGAARANSGGSIGTRYSSSRAQIETDVQTSSRNGNREQTMQATLIHGGAATKHTAIASATYSVATPSTKVTLLDEQVHVAPAVIEQQVVRGVHVESHGVQFHAGVTAPTFIDGFVLPLRRQFVAAASYAWKVSPSITLEPALVTTKGRGIASIAGRYDRGESLQLSAEVAHGNGTAASVSMFANSARQKFALDAIWQPRDFVTASPYDRRGLSAGATWSATFGARVTASAHGSIDDALFAHASQRARTGSAEVRVRATRRLSLFSGLNYGSFGEGVRSVTVPLGASYERRNFGLTAVARLGTQTLRGRSEGFRFSAHAARGSFSASAYVDTETNAPTLALIFRERPDLELVLQQLGLTASTPDDIVRILRDHADLIDAGIISSATVNIAPRRTQSGLDLAWTGTRQSLHLRLLQNRIESIGSTLTFSTATLTWSRRVFDTTSIDLTAGLWSTNGRRTPVIEAGIRHSFDGLPSFGGSTIRGNVIEDDDLDGSGAGLPNVAVQLDATTTIRTDAGGSFAFHGVSRAPHTVTAYLPDRNSYFTSPSRVDVAPGEQVAFGIARSPARVAGRVVNDGGAPVGGVTVALSRGKQLFTAVTDTSGEFAFAAAPGAWLIEVDAQSLPAGYVASDVAPRELELSRSATQNPKLVLRAMRTISGKTAGCKATIDIQPLGRRVETDAAGNFVIRNLPAGTITLAAGGAPTKLELSAGPATLRDVRVATPCGAAHSDTIRAWTPPTPRRGPSPARVTR